MGTGDIEPVWLMVRQTPKRVDVIGDRVALPPDYEFMREFDSSRIL
jgi:hypothetical protein